jgi:hypothetical protein
MFRHAIDICPDNAEELARRLDSLTESGAEIVTVTWQPQRANPEDQAAAFETSGSFLIVSRKNAMAEAAALDDRAAGTAYVA